MGIDTLGYAKYLIEHGLPRETAEAHAEAADRYLLPHLVTSDDLKLATADLKTEMAGLRREMVELKSDLTMRTLGIVGLMNAMFFALLKIT